MRIAVNLQDFRAGRIGGLETVVRRTLGELDACPLAPGQRLDLFCPAAEATAVQAMAPGATVRASDSPHAVAEALERERYDLLYCPLLTLDPVAPGIASAVWIPDLVHEYFPQLFDAETLAWRRRLYRASALDADVVFTGSLHAKRTLVERLGVAADKVRVVLHGIDEELPRVEAPAPAGLPADYLYYPANFWPHKNHRTLLEALAALRRRGRTISLVLTGSPESGQAAVAEAARALGVHEQVHFLGLRRRVEVAALYRGAKALVFPSLFEGFGLPLLEAMSLGTPVIASTAGSVPEVAGDAALSADPLDPEALAAAIERILDDSPLRRELIERGLQRAAAFRWSASLPGFRQALLDAVRAPRPRPPAPRVAVLEIPAEGPPATAFWRENPADAYCFLRPGEALLPGALEQAAAALAAAPGVAGVYGGVQTPSGPLQPDRFRFEDVVARGNIHRPATFLRREAIEAAGGWDASAGPAWFFDLLLRIGREQPLARFDATWATTASRGARRTAFLAAAARRAAAARALPVSWVFALARERGGPLAWPLALPLGLALLPGRRRDFFRAWRLALTQPPPPSEAQE